MDKGYEGAVREIGSFNERGIAQVLFADLRGNEITIREHKDGHVIIWMAPPPVLPRWHIRRVL